LGDELKSKLGDVLKDATDSSPLGLAQKALGQAQKLADTKAVVQQGIANFKSRMSLSPGRMDGLGGLNLGEIKQKADALKAKAQEVQSAISDFQSQFPGCALDPDIMQTINTVASIDTNLDPLSMIDTSKLDAEIAEAQSKIEEATDMQTQSARLQDVFGVEL
jgi:FtsZ-binding cell division protein ZapB